MCDYVNAQNKTVVELACQECDQMAEENVKPI